MGRLVKFFSIFVAVIGLSFVLSGCGGAKLSPTVQKAFDNNEKMYTQLNMHLNPGRGGIQTVETTNYSVGILVPVNSEVVLSSVDAKKLIFTYNGMQVTLINKAKYTGLNMEQTVNRYFSEKKVDLSKFSEMERSAIETAEVKAGISKEAMLVLRGYPPVHATSSLKSDSWKFWENRWNTVLVQFENNKVTKITE